MKMGIDTQNWNNQGSSYRNEQSSSAGDGNGRGSSASFAAGDMLEESEREQMRTLVGGAEIR